MWVRTLGQGIARRTDDLNLTLCPEIGLSEGK